MKALVTGAAGFIGSHLCEHLVATGHDVAGIDCFTSSYDVATKVANLAPLRATGQLTFTQADLRTDRLDDLLAGVEVVFHQAALAGVRASWDARFAEYGTHNILATQRLLEAARLAGVRRFIYASSSSVYGNALRYPTVEDDVPAPFSPYGVTKLAGEHLALAYAHNFGLPTVALRYFTVFGPRQRPDMGIHRLIRCALTGESFHLFGDGTQRREFTFVDDVVEANMLAATADVEPGLICNIAGGSDIALTDLIDLVGQIVGRPVSIVREPAVPGDVLRNRGASERAAEVLNWKAAVDLHDGLRRQVDWHRSELTATSLS